MKVQWLGHSCFVLTESTGTTIVTDPYGHVGYDLPFVKADAVTVSHKHQDHNNTAGVSGSPQIFNKAGFYDIKGVKITGIDTFHDDSFGENRGNNVIFKFRMDGLDICHLGDLGQECTPQLIESLFPVNVLLIPVGGRYTLDGEQAKEYVDLLMPDIVIPMHYKTKSLTLDIEKAEPFLRLFDEEYVEILETDSIELDREDLNEHVTHVKLLRRAK